MARVDVGVSVEIRTWLTSVNVWLMGERHFVYKGRLLIRQKLMPYSENVRTVLIPFNRTFFDGIRWRFLGWTENRLCKICFFAKPYHTRTKCLLAKYAKDLFTQH